MLAADDKNSVSIDVLSNYQDVPADDLVTSSVAPELKRLSLNKYLRDKIQSLLERTEARDLVDVGTIISKSPKLAAQTKALILSGDITILTERLLGWSTESIEADLASYDDISPSQATDTIKLILNWLKEAKP